MVEVVGSLYSGLRSIISNLRKGKSVVLEPHADNITLKIISANKIIAYLTTHNEGKTYVLTYTTDFLKSGIPPFNLDRNEQPTPGLSYESDTLWYAFTSRLPNPNRGDFEQALKEAGLSGTESPLEVLGRLSRYSISKSWTIELDQVA